MKKTDAIARKILGWKLSSWDKWYDSERSIFIQDSDFQPEKNLDHAMLIVEKLKILGFSYTIDGTYNVCFNDVCGTGNTLAKAITNAAYELTDQSSNADEWM